ncbi:MAG: hypothetical protein R3Y13_01145 [bacterium]
MKEFIIKTVFLVLLLITVVVYGYNTFKEDNNEEVSTIAYYVETYYDSDEYVKGEFLERLADYYTLNEDLSWCNNNQEDGTIKAVGDNVEIKFDKANNCVLYFDINQKLIDAIIVDNALIVANDGLDFSSNTDSGFYVDRTTGNYYFRGNYSTLNNWVKIGTTYWRIVRIDESENIRLIYSGTSTSSSGTKTITYSSSSTFSFYSYANSSRYAGYKFSTAARGSTTDSAVKETIDKWYETNLEKYDYLFASDAEFCGDRVSYYYAAGSSVNTTSTTASRYFGGYVRFETNADKKPTFACDEDDQYSVDNGKLKYPIAMLSADEAVFAGIIPGTTNTSNYLYSNKTFWLMTPYSYQSSVVKEFYINTTATLTAASVTTAIGVRPVVAVDSSTIIISGTGSASDPYILAK